MNLPSINPEQPLEPDIIIPDEGLIIQPNGDVKILRSLTIQDIEDVCCGRDTPEQHALYCAAFNDPESGLNQMLTYIREKPSLLGPPRKRGNKKKRKQE